MGSVGHISGFINIKGFTRLPKLSLSQHLLIPYRFPSNDMHSHFLLHFAHISEQTCTNVSCKCKPQVNLRGSLSLSSAEKFVHK